MNIDNPKGIESSVSNSSKQRRTFLKRASVTTIVASLPLSSSWASGTGCSVSGNLSGNLSQNPGGNGQCDMNGVSTQEWSDNTNSYTYTDGEWGSIFAGAPISGEEASYVISVFLAGGGIDGALVAAYLNALNGYYPLADGVTAEAYAEGLRYQVASGAITEIDMLAAIESTWQ